MTDFSHDDIDRELAKKSRFERLAVRCAKAELKYEHLAKWMQEREPEALEQILEETKELGYDMRLEFQHRIGQITRDLGGTIEL